MEIRHTSYNNLKSCNSNCGKMCIKLITYNDWMNVFILNNETDIVRQLEIEIEISIVGRYLILTPFR